MFGSARQNCILHYLNDLPGRWPKSPREEKICFLDPKKKDVSGRICLIFCQGKRKSEKKETKNRGTLKTRDSFGLIASSTKAFLSQALLSC
jgi:hypothetical protein